MFLGKLATRTVLSASVAGAALLISSPALAQPPADPTEAAAAPAAEEADDVIVVTGSLIERAGFSAPTPTTVVGATELRQSAAVNLQQALNDLPQLRNSVSPSQSQANTSAGTAPVELRGLGLARTLTLVNGRRFIGDNNLNFVPTNLVQRVEIVTGGASAAYGSGAVAGVVNIILNDDLEGVSLGAQSGISTRGDGFRYRVDGSFGTRFADGRGHFMVGAEYVDDKGIGLAGKPERPWFGAGIVNIGNGQFEIRPNVNELAAAGQSSFLVARFSRDAFFLTFDAERETISGALGIDGSLGGNWKYSAYYSHGELKSHQQVYNSSIPGNFAKAINAVTNAGGQIVCAVNADAVTTNDDPACVPFNPFGDQAPSAAARAYVTGTQT